MSKFAKADPDVVQLKWNIVQGNAQTGTQTQKVDIVSWKYRHQRDCRPLAVFGTNSHRM